MYSSRTSSKSDPMPISLACTPRYSSNLLQSREVQYQRLHKYRSMRVNRTIRAARSPEEAFTQACREQGVKISQTEEDSDEEDWEDIQEDMEDFWMREPKAESEWAEQALTGSSVKAYQEPMQVKQMSLETFTSLSPADPTRSCLLSVGSEASPSERTSGLHIPLSSLTREAAEQLRNFEVVGVIGSSPTQTQQACIRLGRVFNLQNIIAVQL